MKKDWALVLAGGGGKGAYQIGAWKALKEYGVDKRIGAIAGTSVGALNGALFVQGDISVGEEVWNSIDNDRILSIDKTKHLAALKSFNLGRIFTDGIFSSQGLLDIIHTFGDLDKISSASIPLFATCCRVPDIKLWNFKFPDLDPTYFKLNDLSPKKITDILLASSAIPFVFDSLLINGSRYVDGGIADNVPIKPVYDLGFRKIIVINLDMYQRLPREKFRNADIIEIAPDHSLSEMMRGILDFDPEAIQGHVSQGYNDTIQVLSARFKLPLLKWIRAKYWSSR